MSDYRTRIDNNGIATATEQSMVDDTVDVIEAYVEKMRESGNTNITFEYILDNVHERNLVDAYGNALTGDQTVTYDELIYGWRSHNETKEYLIIDSAYSQYVIDLFQRCTEVVKEGEEPTCECKTSNLTCTQLNNENYAAIEAEIEAEIGELVDNLSELYRITMETNEEYNQYLGASYISVWSTASVKPSVNVNLYTIIAFFFLIFLCCGGAIVLGRLGDIITYIFYTDHLTELNNRAYFDKYLKSMDKKLLDDGTVYSIVEIANLVSINTENSRQTGDEILKMFTRYLKEAFGKTSADYIYNGNGSFVILARGVDYITVEDIFRLFGIRLDEREEYKDIRIEYKVGIAETFKENQTARKLLSAAIKSKKTYVSDPGGEEEVSE